MDDELRFVARQTDTGDERRTGYSRVVKLGLVRYVTSTALADRLQVTYTAPDDAGPATGPANDPWDFWTFRVRGSGAVNGEQSNNSRNINGSLTGNRTTEEWKVSASGNLNVRQSDYTLSDGEVLTDESHDHNASVLIVKSLGDHWAAAVRGRIASTTFLNQDRATRIGGGFEYNFFPYSESSTRQLTVQFTAGINHFKYIETTIYGKDSESAGDGVLAASFDVRQPWGSSGVYMEAASYFHDPGRNRIALSGDIDVRLFKGFSLTVDGSVSRIHDQLYLRAGDATDEEILLRRRQLATNYRYRYSVGLSYTFGSIFNNVVNTRF